MTREEAIERLNIHKSTNVFVDSIAEAIDVAIEALSAPQTDLISRADAIDAVAEEWLSEASAESPYVNDYDIDKYRELAEALFDDVPSADAVRVAYICDGRKCDNDCSECFRTLDIEHARDFKKMGGTYYQQRSADIVQGEWIDSGEYPWSKCNKCGYTITCYQEEEFRYCPSCGVKMKGGAE